MTQSISDDRICLQAVRAVTQEISTEKKKQNHHTVDKNHMVASYLFVTPCNT